MKKALISPNEGPIQYISGWTGAIPNEPIFSTYPNSCRVAEVTESTFAVAAPLFWVDCADNVVADQFYYNKQTNSIAPIENAEP